MQPLFLGCLSSSIQEGPQNSQKTTNETIPETNTQIFKPAAE